MAGRTKHYILQEGNAKFFNRRAYDRLRELSQNVRTVRVQVGLIAQQRLSWRKRLLETWTVVSPALPPIYGPGIISLTEYPHWKGQRNQPFNKLANQFLAHHNTRHPFAVQDALKSRRRKEAERARMNRAAQRVARRPNPAVPAPRMITWDPETNEGAIAGNWGNTVPDAPPPQPPQPLNFQARTNAEAQDMFARALQRERERADHIRQVAENIRPLTTGIGWGRGGAAGND